uniref:Uncharacterized protein n=1 Tax=Ditylenchus dipsaci TaxID=166011 RepID=A0A915E6J1_9BILA
MAPVDSSNSPPKAKIRHTAKEQIPTTYQASCSTTKSMVSSAKKQIPKQSDSSPTKDVQSQEDHPVYQCQEPWENCTHWYAQLTEALSLPTLSSTTTAIPTTKVLQDYSAGQMGGQKWML